MRGGNDRRKTLLVGLKFFIRQTFTRVCYNNVNGMKSILSIHNTSSLRTINRKNVTSGVLSYPRNM